MNECTVATLASDTLIATDCAGPAVRSSRVPALLMVALILVAAYVAFERIGTHANVDKVLSYESYGEGFVVVGMTDSEPGFVCLSALPRNEVDIGVVMYQNRVAGNRTVVEVATAKHTWRKRLRSTEVVLIAADGEISSSPVRWSDAEFLKVVSALDCKTLGTHCGEPLANVRSALEQWEPSRVPTVVGSFLEHTAEQHE